MKLRNCLPSVFHYMALFTSAFFSFAPPAFGEDTLANIYHLQLPGGAPLHAYAEHGDVTFFGTDKGILQKAAHHEHDEADLVWSGGQVDALKMLPGTGSLLFGSGNALYIGSAEDPEQWKRIPDSAFKGGLPKGVWSDFATCGESLLGLAGDVFYISKDNGQQWEPLLADSKVPLATGCYRTLWVIARFPDGDCRIGRSEDLQSWTWSEALPRGFVPSASFFPVFNDRLGIIGGTVPAEKAGNSPQPAIVRLEFDDAGRQGAELFVWGGSGSQPIQVWASLNGLWARLPDGTIANSYGGKDWTLVAKPPLGGGHSKVVGDPRFHEFSHLTGYENGYTIIGDHMLSQIEGTPQDIAWKESVSIEPKIELIAPKPNVPEIASLPGGLPVHPRNRLVQDGTRLFIVAGEQTSIWAADPGGTFKRFALWGQEVGDIAAAGGELLAIVGHGREVLVIDPQSGEVKHRYPSGGGGFSWLDAIDGEFFAVIRNREDAGYTLMRRNPGESEWRYYPLPTFIEGLAKSGGRFYGSASPQGILSSDNCIDWQYAPLEGDFIGIAAIAAAGNRLFRIETQSDYDKNTTTLTLMTTADGENWEMISPLVLPERYSNFRGVRYDGQRYWILYTAGAFVSEDPELKVWRKVTEPNVDRRSMLWPLPDGRVALAQKRGLIAFAASGPSRRSSPLAVNVRAMEGAQAVPAMPDVINSVRAAYEGRQAIIKAEQKKIAEVKAEAKKWRSQGVRAYDKKDYAEAVRQWTKAAEVGDPDAMILLSEMNLGNSKSDADYTMSVGWTKKALAAGDPRAKVAAGLWSDFLLTNAAQQYVDNPEGDPARIRFLLDLESELNAATETIDKKPSVSYVIAHFYGSHLQSERDMQQAVFFGKKALTGKEQRLQEGIQELANNMTLDGQDHFDADRQQLALWHWQGAAELGAPHAMTCIALVYLNPVEVEEDIDKALFWLPKAVALGDEKAKEPLKQLKEEEKELRAQIRLEHQNKAQERATPLLARLSQLRKESVATPQQAVTGRSPATQEDIDNGVFAYRNNDVTGTILHWTYAALSKDAQGQFFFGAFYLTDIADGDPQENLNFGLKNIEASVAQGYAPAIAAYAELKPLLDNLKQEVQAAGGAKPKKSENWLKAEALMKRHLDKDIVAYGAVGDTDAIRARRAMDEVQAEVLVKKGVELFDNGQVELAIEQWKGAAQRGSGQAMFLIATMYMNGMVTGKQELEIAGQWLKKASDAGFEPARELSKSVNDLVRRMKEAGELP